MVQERRLPYYFLLRPERTTLLEIRAVRIRIVGLTPMLTVRDTGSGLSSLDHLFTLNIPNIRYIYDSDSSEKDPNGARTPPIISQPPIRRRRPPLRLGGWFSGYRYPYSESCRSGWTPLRLASLLLRYILLYTLSLRRRQRIHLFPVNRFPSDMVIDFLNTTPNSGLPIRESVK